MSAIKAAYFVVPKAHNITEDKLQAWSEDLEWVTNHIVDLSPEKRVKHVYM